MDNLYYYVLSVGDLLNKAEWRKEEEKAAINHPKKVLTELQLLLAGEVPHTIAARRGWEEKAPS